MDTINSLITNHWNKFMIKVSNYLKEQGRDVTISPYYIDIATDKSRELDIVATKKRKVWGGDRDEFKSFEIESRLFIECKYIDKDFVAWIIPKDENKIDSLLLQQSITRTLSYSSYEKTLPTFLTKHHYKTKQYLINDFSCKDNNKNAMKDWINQCLHGFIYFKDDHKGHSRYSIDYPIVMVNSLDKTYLTDWWDDDSAQADKNLLYQINYSYENKGSRITEDFLIDIVSFELIDDFLNDIEAEREAYWHNLWEHENFEARGNKANKVTDTESFDTFWY